MRTGLLYFHRWGLTYFIIRVEVVLDFFLSFCSLESGKISIYHNLGFEAWNTEEYGQRGEPATFCRGPQRIQFLLWMLTVSPRKQKLTAYRWRGRGQEMFWGSQLLSPKVTHYRVTACFSPKNSQPNKYTLYILIIPPTSIRASFYWLGIIAVCNFAGWGRLRGGEAALFELSS